ncbi:hypothetical protein [Dietzia sp. PP-33]|uniref:hypothetical protein n=1 Tax=Dietzia sp. PP-33 TaxID=2957500 RepID=UPI0029BCDFE3|nr:hypothetical protein [Dietzia sp. PP-33]MDX2358569.1 hypothetical protein [Dietzia sp. PP-33]
MTWDVTGHDGKDPPLAEQIAPAVSEMAAEGHGRNAIARALAVSPSTVTNAARIAGVEFDPAATEVATRSRAEQMAEDRAHLAAMAAEIAKRAGRRLYIELGATVLNPAAVSALHRAFGTGVEKAVLAGATVPDDQADEFRMARVWLDGLHAQIRATELGIIPPDENGNFPIHMGQPGAHLDHHDLDQENDL